MAIEKTGGEEVVVSLPCDSVVPRPDNRPLDPSLVEEMAESYERTGQAVPAIVRPLVGGAYELVDGHHRLAAKGEARRRYPRNAAHRSLDCIVRDLTDAEAEIQAAVANMQKPLTSAEKGRLYERIGIRIDEMRSERPGAFGGMDRGSAIASCASEGGGKVSKATVYRSINAAHAEDGTHEYAGMSEQQRKKVSRMRTGRRKEAASVLAEGGRAALDAWLRRSDLDDDARVVAQCVARIRSACSEMRRCESRGARLDAQTAGLLASIEDVLGR